MNHDELKIQLEKTASSMSPETIGEEDFVEKVAQVSAIVEALALSEHPLLGKLNSDEFREKLAGLAGRAVRALKGVFKRAPKKVPKAPEVGAETFRRLKTTERAKGGFGSVLLDLAAKPFERIPGVKSTLRGAQVGLHRLDETLGKGVVKGLEKVPGGAVAAKAFKKTTKHHLTAKAKPGLPKGVRKGTFFEESGAAVTEPLGKAQAVATPILASIGALSLVNSLGRRTKMVNEQQQLMKQAAAAIDSLAEENKNLKAENANQREKLASFERKDLAYQLSEEMAERGMIDDEEIVKTAAKLVDSDRDLGVVKEALATTQTLLEIGTLQEPEGNAGIGADPLTDFLLSVS